jgi:hypothetical protein
MGINKMYEFMSNKAGFVYCYKYYPHCNRSLRFNNEIINLIENNNFNDNLVVYFISQYSSLAERSELQKVCEKHERIIFMIYPNEKLTKEYLLTSLRLVNYNNDSDKSIGCLVIDDIKNYYNKDDKKSLNFKECVYLLKDISSLLNIPIITSSQLPASQLLDNKDGWYKVY